MTIQVVRARRGQPVFPIARAGRHVRADYPVERLYRELRGDRIWEGTSEIQRLIIAGELRQRGLGFLNLPA
jgi:alkylation response protein AidB-like acyl-CoA dehydrogenase